MTTRQELQDIATNNYSQVWNNCDPLVRAAIENFHKEVTPSHSLLSKKNSVISLIKKHLDIVVNEFIWSINCISESIFLFEESDSIMREKNNTAEIKYFLTVENNSKKISYTCSIHKNIYLNKEKKLQTLKNIRYVKIKSERVYIVGEDSFVFSKMIENSVEAAQLFLKKILWFYERWLAKNNWNKQAEIIEATIHSLRDLVSFCDLRVSADITYVLVDEKEITNEKKRTKQGRAVKNLVNAGFPWYLQFSLQHCCRFCDQVTEKWMEYNSNKKDNHTQGMEDPEIKIVELSKKDVRFYREKEKSKTYCALHNPKSNKYAYNKALKMHRKFLSLMRLIIEILKRNNIQPYSKYELRVITFNIIENYPIKKDLSLVAQAVSDFYNLNSPELQSLALSEMTRLYKKLMTWEDQNPCKNFVIKNDDLPYGWLPVDVDQKVSKL